MIDLTKQDLTVKTAGLPDLKIVLGLLKNAAQWLQTKGIDYWQEWHNPPAQYLQWIKSGLENEEFYLVSFQSRIAGCFRLTWSDELFWGKKTDKAGYVHSLTRVSRLPYKNIGSAILSWIEDYCRQKNKKFLRLDCGINILGLHYYYQNYGFNAVGKVTVHEEELVLYEKEI